MITGHVPFSADTPYAILLKVANDPFPEPRQFAVDIPAGVQTAILKATARNPQDRYAMAAAFVDALETALAENVAATVYDSQPDLTAPFPQKTPLVGGQSEQKPSSQWTLILALIIIACIVLSAIAGGLWFLIGRDQPAVVGDQVTTETAAISTITSADESSLEKSTVSAVETGTTALPTAAATSAAPTETAVSPTVTPGTAAAAALLGEPFLLSDLGRESSDPEALRDRDGTLHAAWLERDPVNAIQRIWHRAQTADGTWSEPDLLYDEGLVIDMKMSLGSAGYPCVFWDSGYGPQQRCDENGSWTAQQALPLNGRDWMPAVNAQGEFASTTIINAGTLVLGGLQLSDDEALAYQPQFTIDSMSRYHTFWIRQGDPFSLEHRWSGDSGQTWQEAVMLSDPDMLSIQTDFAIAADNQGRVHLAFMLPDSKRRVAYRVWEDGIWSETMFLDDPGAGLISLDIALDSAGRVALAWAELGMALTRQLPDGSWSTPTIILNDIQATSLDSFKLSFTTDELLDLIWTDERQIFSAQVGNP